MTVEKALREERDRYRAALEAVMEATGGAILWAQEACGRAYTIAEEALEEQAAPEPTC